MTLKRWNLNEPSGSRETAVNGLLDIAFDDDGATVFGVGLDGAKGKSAIRLPLSNGSSGVPETYEINATLRSIWPRTDFSFSPDAKYLAAPWREEDESREVGYPISGKLGVWATEDWQEVAQIAFDMSHLTSVVWNEDSSLLAVAGSNETSSTLGRILGQQSCQVKIYRFAPDRNMTELVTEIPSVSQTVSLAFKNNTLANSTASGIQIWDLNSRVNITQQDQRAPLEFVPELRFEMPFDTIGQFVDFSPGCDRLAMVDQQGDRFRVIDLINQEVLFECPGPRNSRCIRFSPDGSRLAVVGHDSQVHLCDAETGTQLLTLSGSDSPAGSMPLDARVIFSPDGRKIATQNLQQEIRVWEVRGSGAYVPPPHRTR